jgi:hypothetical protein
MYTKPLVLKHENNVQNDESIAHNDEGWEIKMKVFPTHQWLETWVDC